MSVHNYAAGAMEARDSGSKIRPLPVDDLDVETPPRSPLEPKHRLTPLIVIAAGAVAFGVIAAGLGPGNPDQVTGQPPPPPTTIVDDTATPTTTTTVPETPAPLGELIPFADNGLRLVTLSATTARVGGWSPDSVYPVFNANISQPTAAAFNADGTRVAVEISTSREEALIIDDATSGNPTFLRSANSGVWHADEPNLFAWSEIADESKTIIRVGDLSGDTSLGLGPLYEFVIDGEHRLQAWGDWGFATQSAGVTFVYDSDGIETHNAAGTLFGASGDGVLLLRANVGNSVPFLVYPDGSMIDLPSLDVGATDYHITTDGEWVLAITLQADGHTSILAKAVNSRSTRLTSVDKAARVVGSFADDRVLVLQEAESNDLVFKDWSSGAEFRVPIGQEVGAVYVPGRAL